MSGYFQQQRGIFWRLVAAVILIAALALITLLEAPNWHHSKSEVESDYSMHSRFRRAVESKNGSIDEKPRRRSPQAIIIGVKKGGTRALLEYLRMHPDVKAAGPELHFFDRYYHFGAGWYRRQMPPTMSGQVAIEKTPSYFVTKEAPSRLRLFDPNVKLIVVLRNPVTRALSDYAQNAAKRPAMLKFEDLAFVNTTKIDCALSSNHSIVQSYCNASGSIERSDATLMVNTSWGAIRIGIYHRYVKRWFQHFDPERVHFVSGEALITDPASETNAVEQFLGLRRVIDNTHFVYPNSATGSDSNKRFPCLRPKRNGKAPRCLGKTKGRKHPNVNIGLLRTLDDFYKPHNEKLYKLIGRRFDW